MPPSTRRPCAASTRRRLCPFRVMSCALSARCSASCIALLEHHAPVRHDVPCLFGTKLARARPRSPSLSLPDALVQTCLVQDRPRPAAGVSSADAGLGHALSQAPRKRSSQEQTWALDLEPIEPRLVKGVDFCERWVLLYGTVNRHTDPASAWSHSRACAYCVPVIAWHGLSAPLGVRFHSVPTRFHCAAKPFGLTPLRAAPP